MAADSKSGRPGKGLRQWLGGALLALGAVAAQAAVLTGQGTRYGTDGTLLGRDINGNPLNLLNLAGTAPNPDMVFFYDTHRNQTWLANWNVNGLRTWSAAVTWASTLTVGTLSG